MAQIRPLVAKQSFAFGNRVIRKGTRVRSDDPVVKGRGHLFTDALEDLGIEQATAVPGQRRNAARAAEPDVSKFHTGGGWYQLPDGRKIQGKAAAQEALSGGEE